MINNPIENRNIRVFISSTFQDMQNERDYLMQRTFPKLRDLASKRNVMLTEVDLRWGITEEEANSGNVVDVCLREIENSVPFFIGIIGNRYGWVPSDSDINTDTKERFPDVNSYLKEGLSVTEMEMQFGVLKREEDLNAFFYIKEQQGESDNPTMLEHLKQEVVASRYPSSTYVSKEDLANQVEKAFVNLLDEYFPEQELKELSKERISQLMRCRQLCQVYLPRNEEQNLDDWYNSNEHSLLVLGASGVGKSAMVTNWLKRRRDISSEFYYVGVTARDLDTIRCELKQLIQNNQPQLIMIDGVEKIIDGGHPVDGRFTEQPLINFMIPQSLRVIFIMSNRQDVDNWYLLGDEYKILKLNEMEIEQRAKFINSYLSIYSKQLNSQYVDLLVSNELLENTGVLRAVLDVLCISATHDNLDAMISAFSPPQEDCNDLLYQLYYINDSKDTRPIYIYAVIIHKLFHSNVKAVSVLRLLEMSLYGLTEKEMMQLSDCSQLEWSQIFYMLLPFLMCNCGRYQFDSFNLYYAVRSLYVRDANMVSWRQKLINIFETNSSRTSNEELINLYYDQSLEVSNNLEKFHNMHRCLAVLEQMHESPYKIVKAYIYFADICCNMRNHNQATTYWEKAESICRLHMDNSNMVEMLEDIQNKKPK